MNCAGKDGSNVAPRPGRQLSKRAEPVAVPNQAPARRSAKRARLGPAVPQPPDPDHSLQSAPAVTAAAQSAATPQQARVDLPRRRPSRGDKPIVAPHIKPAPRQENKPGAQKKLDLVAAKSPPPSSRVGQDPLGGQQRSGGQRQRSSNIVDVTAPLSVDDKACANAAALEEQQFRAALKVSMVVWVMGLW